jgi:hypothetical protein
MTLVDDIWWLEGMAKREVLGMLTVIPEKWKWAMEWPVKQFQRLKFQQDFPLSYSDGCT